MGAGNVIREIRRSTRRRFSLEEKIRIVVEVCKPPFISAMQW